MTAENTCKPKSKICFKCNVEKEITDFYAHPATRDGHLNKCKECAKRDVREHRENNLERIRQYDTERANNPERILARKEYRKTPQGRAAVLRSHRKWAKNNPLKRDATVKVGNAVRDGRLLKQPCEVCGETVVEAHHDDYSKPLDVRWLCNEHHREWHKHNKPIVPTPIPF